MTLKFLQRFAFLFFCNTTYAAPANFNFQGKIVDANDSPLEASSVIFTVTILSPGAEGCRLYEETHNLNMTGTHGFFNLTIGSGSRSGTDYEDTATLSQALDNSLSNLTSLNCSTGNSYDPANGDSRKLRLSFFDGTNTTVLAQDHVLNSVPFSQYASKLEGKSSSDFLQVKNNISTVLSQSNLEWLFDSTRYSELQNLVNGTSSNFMKSNPTVAVGFNNQRITNVATPTVGTDATNKNYVDANLGGNSINTGVLAGGDSGKLLSWDGSNWIAVNPAGDNTKLSLSGGTMSGTLNMGNQDITNVKDLTVNNSITVSGGIGVTSGINSSGNISLINQSDIRLGDNDGTPHYIAIQASSNMAGNLTLTLPPANSIGNQVLQNDGSGNLSWVDMSVGDITDIAAGSGLAGGGGNGNVTLNVGAGSGIIVNSDNIEIDFGTGANSLLKLSDFAGCSTDEKISITGPGPIFSKSCIADDAKTILGKSLPATPGAGQDGQILKWNNVTNAFVWSNDDTGGGGSGDIESVNAGTGLSGGGLSGAVTLGIAADGVTSTELANNAVTSAKINDGAVTNSKISSMSVNKITSAVGSYFDYMPNGTECNLGDGLSWDNANDRWLCVSPTIGTITELTGDVSASGSGSIAATINSVSGVTAANVASGANLANAATSSNTASAIVRRDASGNFSAGTISATAANLNTNGLVVGTDQLVTSGGNVGIGTASPSSKLEIYGGAFITSRITTTNTANYSGLEFFENTNYKARIQQIGSTFADSTRQDDLEIATAGGADFSLWPGGAFSAVFKSDGKLGIGTNSPSSILDINGAQTIREIATASAPTATAGKYFIYADSTSHTLKLSSDGGSYFDILTSGTAGLGDISGVTAGAGLINGGITGSVTLDVGAGTGIVVNPNDIAVDVGNTDGKIVQVQTGGKLPALDASDLTNIEATDITAGTLAVARGGTGQSTYTDGQLLIGNSTGNTLTKSTLTQGTGINITNGGGSISIASSLGTSVDLASEVTGTLPVASGGTGATSLTANNVLLGNGTSAFQVVAPGSSGNVLTSNGTTWVSQASSSALPTISTKSVDFTVGSAEENYVYLVSGSTVATLPTLASVSNGFRVTVKRTGVSNITIDGNGSETIDGALTRNITSTNGYVGLVKTATEWKVISGGATDPGGTCVAGSASYPGGANTTFAATVGCTYTFTVKAAGGGHGIGGTAGAGGGIIFSYTPGTANNFTVVVGQKGNAYNVSSGAGGFGGGAGGGRGGAGGGGGASGVAFNGTLLAIAGGGGGGGATSGNGGTGGSGGGGGTGGTATEGGAGGSGNTGGIGGVGGSGSGGTGGSSATNGANGGGTGTVGAGGVAVASVSISGGGGGASSGTGLGSGGGGGGGGYGGGGGGGDTNEGGGGGGGGYVGGGAFGSSSTSGAAAGSDGTIDVIWN